MSSSEGFFSPAEQQVGQQDYDASLRALRQDFAAVEKAMKALLAADTALAHCYERITSVSGAGLVTAVEILLTTNEF